MSFLEPEVRRPSKSADGLRRAGLNEYGDLQVSQLLPPLAKLASMGKLFVFDASAGTAKAPVTAPPTTSPEWGLYNGSSTECLVVIRASVTLKSGTAGLGLALLGATALGAQTAVTANYTSAIVSCTDGSGRGSGNVFITNNPTLIGGTPAWMHFEGTKVNTVGTDSVGDTLTADIGGALIARPKGGMVAFEVLGETGTTALYYPSFLVAMLELDYH